MTPTIPPFPLQLQRPEARLYGKLEAVVATYARSALHNRRLAWALVNEPADRLVDAERLA